MAKSSELIAKAEECARLAQTSDAVGVKYRYAIAADQWREMAEEKEKASRPRSRCGRGRR
jgi:hypothetical protein